MVKVIFISPSLLSNSMDVHLIINASPVIFQLMQFSFEGHFFDKKLRQVKIIEYKGTEFINFVNEIIYTVEILLFSHPKKTFTVGRFDYLYRLMRVEL